VWVSFNDAAYLKRRHGIGDELIKGISAAGGFVDQALQ